jgi:hypothetical protein
MERLEDVLILTLRRPHDYVASGFKSVDSTLQQLAGIIWCIQFMLNLIVLTRLARLIPIDQSYLLKRCSSWAWAVT